MHKPPALSCLLLLTFSLSSFADTEFQGPIPLETVEALFNTYGEDKFQLYSDIAESFPEFPVPPEFEVVGSVSQMSTLRVIFQTDLDEEEALQSIRSAFESLDWIPFPTFNMPSRQVGFISPQDISYRRPEVLCHDEQGNLTIRYFMHGTRKYVSTGVPKIISGQQGSCEQQIARQQASMGAMPQRAGLRQYLPRMEIPESQSLQRRPVLMTGGTSMSGNSIETDGLMTSDQGIDVVYNFFAEQIQSQEWELDSESIGSRSATGTWIKSPEPNLSLVGTLSIIDLGDDEFELRFRMAAEGFSENSLFSPRRQ